MLREEINGGGGGGNIAQWFAYLLPDPAAPGLIPSIAKNISEEKIVDVPEAHHQRRLEESGEWLDRTQLVVLYHSGKLALQKRNERSDHD